MSRIEFIDYGIIHISERGDMKEINGVKLFGKVACVHLIFDHFSGKHNLVAKSKVIQRNLFKCTLHAINNRNLAKIN